MKKAEELYGPFGEGEWFYATDYMPMLAEFGDIILKIDDDYYQGDSRILYTDGGYIYGYLQFGWGSCSGCDALQACMTIPEVQALMDELHGSIKWFKDRAEAYKFFTTHDWPGDYSWTKPEQRRFIAAAIIILSPETYFDDENAWLPKET